VHESGAKVDASQFQSGKTTMAEVVNKLGPPRAQSTSTGPDGSQQTTLGYAWVRGSAGGAESQATSFVFDQNGVLTRTFVQSGNSGAR